MSRHDGVPHGRMDCQAVPELANLISLIHSSISDQIQYSSV